MGYTDTGDRVVVGEPTLTIHKVNAEELKESLKGFGYNPTADNYYCITISNAHFESYSIYKERISNAESYANNSNLRKHAPKVI